MIKVDNDYMIIESKSNDSQRFYFDDGKFLLGIWILAKLFDDHLF